MQHVVTDKDAAEKLLTKKIGPVIKIWVGTRVNSGAVAGSGVREPVTRIAFDRSVYETEPFQKKQVDPQEQRRKKLAKQRAWERIRPPDDF